MISAGVPEKCQLSASRRVNERVCERCIAVISSSVEMSLDFKVTLSDTLYCGSEGEESLPDEDMITTLNTHLQVVIILKNANKQLPAEALILNP